MWSTERQREGKKEHMSGGSLALTHLSALVLSYLSSRTSFYLSFFPLHLFLRHPAPCVSHTSFPFLSATLPPFHFSSLAPCLYHSPLSTFYLSISSLSCQKLSLHLWGPRVIHLQLLVDLPPVCLYHVSSLPLTEVRDNCSSMPQLANNSLSYFSLSVSTLKRCSWRCQSTLKCQNQSDFILLLLLFFLIWSANYKRFTRALR